MGKRKPGKKKDRAGQAILAVALAMVLVAGVLVVQTLAGAGQKGPASNSAPVQAEGESADPGGFTPDGSYEKALVQQPATPKKGDAEVSEAYRAGLAGFSFETASLLLANGEANGNYSPASFYLALAMLANGAEGEAQADMLALLGANSMEELNTSSNALIAGLQRERETSEIDIANSLWMQKGYKFDDAFVQTIAERYYGWLFTVDFDSGEADKYAAAWISDMVRGTIRPDVSTNPDPYTNTILRIINTIYFRSNWSSEFYPGRTEKEDFTLQSGEIVQVDMMHQHSREDWYINGESYVAYTKYMHGGSMRFVLPDEGVDVDALLADPARLAEAMGNDERTEAEIEFGLPKFSFADDYDLTGAMEQLGLESLTDRESGALNAMAEDGEPKYDLFVAQALQESFIALDEEGVEAAAYTQEDVGEPASDEGEPEPLPLVEIILERPFIYGIYSGDTLLFIGVVRNPLEG